MAIQTVTLYPFNTLVLASGVECHLVAPTPNYYVIVLVNWSGGNVAVSDGDWVSLSDPASFTIPTGSQNASDIPYPFRVWGPTGIWVAGTGELSVLCMPG